MPSAEMKFFILALWISSLISVHCQVVTLNGAWRGTINICDKKPFEKCNNEYINFSGIVPGGIYTDLHKNNIIENNLFGKNDINNRWVGNQSVIYTKNFSASDNFLKARKIVLVFHGIDTFANVSLNDHVIGETSNMFLRYIFDVTDFIKKGQNLLKVTFRSAVKVAKDLYNEQEKHYVVPPVCVPKNYNGQCHINHIRKMQASFSWDWGPAFPSIGIWRDVELIPVNDILINDITADIRKENNAWSIFVTIFLEATQSKDEEFTRISCHVTSILHISESKLISNTSEIVLDANRKYINVNISLIVPVDAVENWWPNGYGKQHLYYLNTTVTTANSVLYKRIRIGFRTVELVEEPLKKGLSFYFRINGIPIFAKGSNFIPASIFPELGAKEDTIRHLLSSARETHMNMLRVWGGGVYESKLFYDLADEYGIMIWQDFMFACAMYPSSDSFLKSVKEEILQNVIRLKNHPSIVLWAGNNENEVALDDNWYGTGSAQVYGEDYVKLYVNLLKMEMEKLDPIRPFVVSSPGNGAYEKTYNYIGGKDPYSNLYGDVHYYNYFRNGWDITQYPRTRFCSEYGVQSWPSIYTILTAVESIEDLHINSDFVKHRQHQPFGNQFMFLLIWYNFAVPQSNNSIRDFASYVYLSQINQAVSIRIETEAYRQAKSEVNSIGEGMTMGALYWQLNDVWQAPSWSSIDIEGRWKMLHYYAQDFFAPIIVTSYLSLFNKLSIYVVSDRLYTLTNCTVKLHVYKWESMKPISTLFFNNIVIESNKAMKVTSFWLDIFLLQAGCGLLKFRRSCIATLFLTDESGSLIAPVNYIYPNALKNANIPVANVTMKVEENYLPGKFSNSADFKIVLSTDNITLFVWLEVGNIRGRFSENGFHMFVKKKEIIFHAYEATTIELLQSNIKLTHLSDIYNAQSNFEFDYTLPKRQI